MDQCDCNGMAPETPTQEKQQTGMITDLALDPRECQPMGTEGARTSPQLCG